MLKPKTAAALAGLWRLAARPVKELGRIWPALAFAGFVVASFGFMMDGLFGAAGLLAGAGQEGPKAAKAPQGKPVLEAQAEPGFSLPAGSMGRIDSDTARPDGSRVVKMTFEVPAPAAGKAGREDSAEPVGGEPGASRAASKALDASLGLAAAAYLAWCLRMAAQSAFVKGAGWLANALRMLGWLISGGFAGPAKPLLSKAWAQVQAAAEPAAAGKEKPGKSQALAWAAAGGCCAGFVGAAGFGGMLAGLLLAICAVFCAGLPLLEWMGHGSAGRIEFWIGCGLDALAGWKVLAMLGRALAPQAVMQKARRAYENLADMGADGYAAAEAKALGKACGGAKGRCPAGKSRL